MRIGRGEEEPALVHGHAAMADVLAHGGGMIEVPDHVAGSGIDGPDIVGHGEVENSINQQRRGFDLCGLIGLKRPGEAKVLHIVRTDLRKTAVPPAGVVAVVSGQLSVEG